jgi:hypothetical protein
MELGLLSPVADIKHYFSFRVTQKQDPLHLVAAQLLRMNSSELVAVKGSNLVGF